MIDTPQRLRIVGGPGSGKTYLANRISLHTNLSYLNLDDLFWSKGSVRDSEERDELLSMALKHERWIVEGSYDDKWAYDTFTDATTIIVLQPLFIVRFYRLISGYVSSLFSGDAIPFRKFWSHLKQTFAYNLVHLHPLLSNEHLKRKAVLFRKADDAYEYYVKETAPDLFL